MEKVILVMNDPIRCSNCPLSKYMHRHDTWVCGMPHSGGFDMIFEPVDMEAETRPNWCPLKPAPEKIDIPDFDDTVKAKSDNAFEVGAYMYDRGNCRGYNACIDKILNT
jgi:hypothetical protein